MDRIERFLLKVGIPASLRGFQYLHRALELIGEDRNRLYAVYKEVYERIAAESDTSLGCVVRTIQHAMEVAFDRMLPELQEELFGNSIQANRGIPTQKEFLAAATLHLKEKEE